MRKSTRGYCKYCSKEYTRTGMVEELIYMKRQQKPKNILNCCYMERTIKITGLLYRSKRMQHWMIWISLSVISG